MRSFITILLMLCSLTILAELSDKTSSILVAQEFGSTNKDLPNLLEKRRQKKEIPAIIVKGEALRTGENEKAATISVRLNVRPIANVTVSATSSDGTEGSLLKSTLEFTPENWDLFQKFDVIGVDDEIVDPEEEYEVILNVGSVSDFRFSQIEKRALKIINQDNDKAGFEVNKVEEATTEGGRKTSFRLRLTSKPSSRVGLSFKTDRSSEGKMITDRISFSPDNWNQFQPVFVQGVDDFVQDGTQKYRILPGNAVSSDGDYKGLRFPPVTVLNNDNDRAAILAATSKNQTSESGGFSVVKIRLNSEPVADVKVLVSTSEQSEGKPNPDTLVFNSKNWNKEQVLKVIGSDDFLKDGDQPYKIDFSAISKGDSNYANLRSVALAFINKDNDVPGFVINEIQSYSSEKGEKAQFNVRLTTKPKANVTIGLKSDNPKEGRLIRKSLVFTP
ncbi:MAG: hypothetical protein GY786_24255, partial [Proteobacteria bacterium]|nr:hypothetical protein [Pseudomonadota bacterium]